MPARDDAQPHDPAAPTGSEAGSDEAADVSSSAAVPEDTKRRFREALQKKHAHGGRDVSDGGGQAKVHDAHGPASTQRTFRRKSGG